MQDLMIGIALIIIGTGSLLACIPRGEKTVWFVGNQFLEPVLPIFMIFAVAVGLVFITGHFSNIDDMNFAGTVEEPGS